MAIITTLIILSILILVHEAGHFLIARRLGIRVLTFSLGFGPKLVTWRWGETEFAISAIPFGGYVKMAGDEPEDRPYEPDEFLGRPVSHRFSVVLGGPIFNILLGFVVFLMAYGIFGLSVIPGTTVYRVEPGSVAEQSGLQAMDQILAVDQHPVRNWWEIDQRLLKPGTHILQVSRSSDTLRLMLTVQEPESLGIEPLIPPVIGKVIRGGPADQAGLRTGDQILASDTLPVRSWSELVEIVSAKPGDTVVITVLRNGDTLHLAVPVEKSQDEMGNPRGRIGVVVATIRHRLGPVQVLTYSAAKTVESVVLTFTLLIKLILRQVSVKAIGGPVMIGKIVGQTADVGLFQLFFLVAIISVNLGVINLLPIPALDGGHLFLYTLEAIRRKPLSPKVQLWIQQIGMALLILLMILITFLDLTRIFGGK